MQENFVFAQSILLVGKRLMKTMFLVTNQQYLKRENLEIASDLQKKKFNVDESIDMTVENESELSVMKHEKDVQMQEQKGTANISKVSS